MCGICGSVSMTKPWVADQNLIRVMTNTMRHRGPDGGGVYFSNQTGSTQPFVGLGHRRLSIMDLAGGAQPLFNETHDVVAVVNGEIYNYPEMARDLASRGHVLRTRSDSEIVVHAYEEYGLDFLTHLMGMYAIALWDEDLGRLVLARDRLGQKPLHYFNTMDSLIFASEIKGLLPHPLVERRIDLKALNKFLSFEYVPAPATILEGVRKVEPGTMVIWERGSFKVKRYWDLKINQSPEHLCSEKEYVDRFDELFTRSVKRRLMSDVEVGVLLSGGVDSSLVAAKAAELAGVPMRAFNISFQDKSFDELDYAEKAAAVTGMDLTHEELNEAKLISAIGNITDIMDEPMADPSLVPTYLLSKLTSHHTKVALSGDGGDDLLAGYVTFPALKLVNVYKILPISLRTFINKFINKMRVSHRYLSMDFKFKQFMRGEGWSSEIMFFIWMCSFMDHEKQRLFNESSRQRLRDADTYEDIFKYLAQAGLGRDLERILYLGTKLYLQDDILVKVDRASMASSLEVRSPFLDHELVEFINHVPADLKLKGLRTKYLLKKLAERYLPKEIVHRKKKGFGMPVARWFCSDLKEMLTDYLSPERVAAEGIFDPGYVESLVSDHLEQRQNNYKQLWTLMVFEMWMEKYMSAARSVERDETPTLWKVQSPNLMVQLSA
jgi:asparagine synthase (glutamine-hydrolysing)